MNPTIQITAPDSGGDLVPNLPRSENKKFYPALDGLRAVAALLVFHQHYLAQPVQMRWGWAGVDIFFVLSGFLITGILYDTRNAKNRFRTFYVRRSLRIFPLYYALFLFALITTPIFHWVWNGSWYLWLFYLGNFAQIDLFNWLLKGQPIFDVLRPTRFLSPYLSLTFGHLWSLCVEEQFYLVWPFVVYFIKDRVRLRNLCAFIVVLTPLVRLVCYLTLSQKVISDDFLYRFTPLRVDALLLGAFIALCLRGPEAEGIKKLARPVLIAFVTLFVVGTAVSLIITHHFIDPDTRSPLVSTFGFTFIDLAAASVLLLSLNPRNLIFKVLNFSWLRRLGQMSYGFYVYHRLLYSSYVGLTIWLFGPNLRHANLPISIFGFVGTVLVSYLSFRFFESKFLLLKDRLAP